MAIRQCKWTQERIEVEARAYLRKLKREIKDYDEKDLGLYILLAYISEDDVETSPWLTYLLSQHINSIPEEYRTKPRACYRVVQYFNKVLDNTDSARKRGFFSAALTLDAAKDFYDNTGNIKSRDVRILLVDHKQADYAISINKLVKTDYVKNLFNRIGEVVSSISFVTVKKRISKEKEYILIFKPTQPMYNFDFIPF